MWGEPCRQWPWRPPSEPRGRRPEQAQGRGAAISRPRLHCRRRRSGCAAPTCWGADPRGSPHPRRRADVDALPVLSGTVQSPNPHFQQNTVPRHPGACWLSANVRALCPEAGSTEQRAGLPAQPRGTTSKPPRVGCGRCGALGTWLAGGTETRPLQPG